MSHRDGLEQRVRVMVTGAGGPAAMVRYLEERFIDLTEVEKVTA